MFFREFKDQGKKPTQSEIISKAKQLMKEVYDIEI